MPEVQRPAKLADEKSSYTLEDRISAVWREVLNAAEIDPEDSFHELGGDSILATKLARKMAEIFPDLVDVSDIYSYPTVAAMAEFLADKVAAPASEPANAAAPPPAAASTDSCDLRRLLSDIRSGTTSTEEGLAHLAEHSSKPKL